MADLRALLEKAAEDTPIGNWRAEETEDGYWSINATGDGTTTAIHTHITFGPEEETHRLIVEAVNALPALLDVVEAARWVCSAENEDEGGEWSASHDALRAALAALDRGTAE